MDGSQLYARYLEQLNETKINFGCFSQSEKSNIQTDPFYINREEAISTLALIDTIAPYINDMQDDAHNIDNCCAKLENLRRSMVHLIDIKDTISKEDMSKFIRKIILEI
jgi:hypothetical protein